MQSHRINAQGIYDGNGRKVVDFKKETPEKINASVNMLCNSDGMGKHKKLIQNSTELGAEIVITNLTYIRKEIIEQKFYEIKPSVFVPIVVGEGAFDTHTTVYRKFKTGQLNEAGMSGTSAPYVSQENSDFAIDSLTIKHNKFVEAYTYDLFEMKQLAKIQFQGNPIAFKEEVRKTMWDLTIQQTAFLGSAIDPAINGLMNLDSQGVTVDTITLTDLLSNLSTDDFCLFPGKILSLYLQNTNFTAMPNVFTIPTMDWVRLNQAVSPVAPFNTRLQYMTHLFNEALVGFAAAQGKPAPEFKILPLVYGDKDKNNGGKNRYCLYNKDHKTLQMSIPLDYTTTIIDTYNGFNYTSTAYGQYTGILVTKPQEIYYLDNTASLSS